MRTRWLAILALSAVAGMAHADDLCAKNPYTKREAELGKVAFDSRCALCHQFSMAGREPGNSGKESPDIRLLTKGDVEFLDGNGGATPPLVGAKFFSKQKDKSVAEFSAFVSSAANTFPAAKMEMPHTYFHLAAYILYRNCGKM